MQLDWTGVSVVHGILGALTLALAIALLIVARGAGERRSLVRKRVIVLLVVIAAQGLIGVVQAVTGLPEALVSLHLLGSALVWVGALRVLLDANPTLFAGIGARQPTVALAANP
jgi:cytochrome c oxidase assembly protein subunit 15